MPKRTPKQKPEEIRLTGDERKAYLFFREQIKSDALKILWYAMQARPFRDSQDWYVPSFGDSEQWYIVAFDGTDYHCDCPARKTLCAHIRGVHLRTRVEYAEPIPVLEVDTEGGPIDWNSEPEEEAPW